jgi:hypothetical protein
MYFVAKPNTDAFNFLDAAGITRTDNNSAIIIAIANLTADLKNYGLWDKMRAIYPFVGSSENSHKLNLKDPRDLNEAYRLNFSIGWVYSSLGLLANGTSTTANTYIDVSTFMTDSAGSYGVYLNTYTPSQGIPVSKNNGGVEFGTWRFDRLESTGNNIYWGNDLGTITTGQTSGFLQLYKNNSNTTEILNNTTKRQLSTAATSLPSGQIIYGAYDNNGSFGSYINNYTRFLYFGDALTDTEAANFYTAVQRFQTTLGRQV